MLFPAHLASHTVEGLYADHGRERPWIYSLLLLGALAVLIGLPLLELEVSVSAPGMVRPSTERVPLRAGQSGRVVEVLVRENDLVRSGQVLIRLGTDDLDERVARNEFLQRQHRGAVDDCEQAIAWLAAKEASLGAPSLRLAFLQREVAHQAAQRQATRLAVDRAQSEATRATVLASKGIATGQELDNARYELKRVEAELHLLEAQNLMRWQNRLQEERDVLAELVSLQRRLHKERTHAVLCAPATGVLIGFTGCEPGVNVSAAQELGAISPQEALVVETYVASRDIGLVRVGQRARLQIDAYPYTAWGMLEGVVTGIGGDWTSSENRPVFKVSIRPETTRFALRNGASAELRKGLTLSARFLVGRRTLLELLREGTADWLDPWRGDRGA